LNGSGYVRTKNIVRRLHVVIDVDPLRFGPTERDLVEGPADAPANRPRPRAKCHATAAEKAEAEALADHVRATLIRWGFPDPVLVVDSGNGRHLWYAIDLPVSAGTDRLLADLLRALDQEHGGRFAARVDRSMFDPPRVARVPGTENRKYQ